MQYPRHRVRRCSEMDAPCKIAGRGSLAATVNAGVLQCSVRLKSLNSMYLRRWRVSKTLAHVCPALARSPVTRRVRVANSSRPDATDKDATDKIRRRCRRTRTAAQHFGIPGISDMSGHVRLQPVGIGVAKTLKESPVPARILITPAHFQSRHPPKHLQAKQGPQQTVTLS